MSFDPTEEYIIPDPNHYPMVIHGASTTAAGVMSAADKVKLDGLGGASNLRDVYAAGTSQAEDTMLLDTFGVWIRDNAVPLAVDLFGVYNSTGATRYFAVTPTRTSHPAGSAVGTTFTPGIAFASDTASGLALGFGTEIDVVYGNQAARFQTGDTWLNVVAGLYTSFDSGNGGSFLAQGPGGASAIAIQGNDNAGQVEWYSGGTIDFTLARTAAQTVTLSSTAGNEAAALVVIANDLATGVYNAVRAQNTTPATAEAQEQDSPTVTFQGTAWDGAASKSLAARLAMRPNDDYAGRGSGAYNPVLVASVDLGDGLDTKLLRVYTDPLAVAGTILDSLARQMLFKSDGGFGWGTVTGNSYLFLSETLLQPVTSGTLDFGDSTHRFGDVFLSTIDTSGTYTLSQSLVIGTNNTEYVTLTNTTAAAGGATKQYSPVVALGGRGWTGAASQAVKIGLQMQPTDGGGNSPTADLAILHSTNGGAYTQLALFRRVSTNPASPGVNLYGDNTTSRLQLSSFGGTVLAFGTDTIGIDSVAASAISLSIGGAEQVRFTTTGVFRNMVAAKETATATAGGAVIPVTARGFLSFVDSGGTTRKIAYFDV